jgi:hypothetical protein
MRIQSTVCEQKNWGTLLLQTPDSFYYHLATAAQVELHDRSERDRFTRAQWQGVPALCYMIRRIWTDERPKPFILSRDGCRLENVGVYWEKMYNLLPKTAVKKVAYFRRFYEATETVARLAVVDCRHQSRVVVPWWA